MNSVKIEVPFYGDSLLQERIDVLEIQVKKLQGWKLKKVRELKSEELGYILGKGYYVDECINERDLLRWGVMEWVPPDTDIEIKKPG